MKTTIIIISIFTSILLSNTVFAQEKNELKIAYGYSGVDFYTDLCFSDHCDRSFGTISLSYSRKVYEKISLGLQVNYSPIIENHIDWEQTKNRQIIIPLAKVDYAYLIKPEFEMYSSLMVGPLGIDNDFAFHLTALGLRVGAKHAFLAELGFGYGHIVSMGYSVKL